MSLNDDMQMHSMLQILQTIEVGLVVLDKENRIQLWNSFMENHSGVRVAEARHQNIFKLFPDLPEQWLTRKIKFVFGLNTRAYSTWEQRPHVFHFANTRPLTGQSSLMYQNLSLTPLLGPDGNVSHVCILVYDVTDNAIHKIGLEEANTQLQELSQTDGLTGLSNRGHLEQILEKEFQRQARYQGNASLILFDIDHFKAVNDTFGHQVGDDVLANVARLTQSTLRNTDIAGRYGGEEFALLLPDTTPDDALILAERLRLLIQNSSVTTEDAQISVTVSLGIAAFTPAFNNHNDWLVAADKALYASKRSGRNRTSTHSGD